VSLSPSTTRPFDAPEFIFTMRCRHPTRGHCFCPRVLYSLNPPPPFGPIRELYNSPFRGATLRFLKLVHVPSASSSIRRMETLLR
jgi:hypothetical protein